MDAQLLHSLLQHDKSWVWERTTHASCCRALSLHAYHVAGHNGLLTTMPSHPNLAHSQTNHWQQHALASQASSTARTIPHPHTVCASSLWWVCLPHNVYSVTDASQGEEGAPGAAAPWTEADLPSAAAAAHMRQVVKAWSLMPKSSPLMWTVGLNPTCCGWCF
jgi:hypothetical protein